ncbi:hypothetical protein Tco_0660357 [Tanacetum coccineum]
MGFPIRRIHQKDRRSVLTSPDTTKDLSPMRRIQEHQYVVFKDLLYTKLLEDIKRGPYSKKSQYAVKMDDPNITMEEYIRLEEEKARRRGKVYNWETATYDKIWDNKDVHDLRSVETEFPAISLNDEVSIRRILGNGYGVLTSCTVLGPRERNIDEYWWRIYISGDLKVLES